MKSGAPQERPGSPESVMTVTWADLMAAEIAESGPPNLNPAPDVDLAATRSRTNRFT